MSNFFLDVIQKDSRYHSVAQINDIRLLEPTMRDHVQGMIADARDAGVQLIVGETYRSKERQQYLYLKGVTKLREVGVHHYGLACDLWIEHNGQVDWKADYHALGPWALKRRLIWGFDWGTPGQLHSFRDIDHVQRVTIARQTQLFAGSWYPDSGYDPLKELGR